MSKAAIKTNNDPNYIKSKIRIRLESLPEKEIIYILDCFGGEGVLWKEVQKQTNKKLIILSIDQKKYNRIQLIGNNLKYIKSIDLNRYDIIDLDSYGSPFKQLEVIFKKQYRGVVHCTYIQSMLGMVDKQLCANNGISQNMYKKCPTLYGKKAFSFLFGFLYNNGVKKIKKIEGNRKIYFTFNAS